MRFAITDRHVLYVAVQGSHASWKVLEKYPENYAFFIGSNVKQAKIVTVPVCVEFYLLK